VVENDHCPKRTLGPEGEVRLGWEKTVSLGYKQTRTPLLVEKIEGMEVSMCDPTLRCVGCLSFVFITFMEPRGAAGSMPLVATFHYA